MRPRIAAPILLFALTACGSANPSLYILRPKAAATTRPAPSAPAVALRQVVLPSYARDARLAERLPNGALIHLDGHRWADAPNRAITRALAASLRSTAQVDVAVEPWPAQFAPDLTVAVHFDIFDATRGATAELAGYVEVLQPQSDDEPFRHWPFRVSTDVGGPTFGAVMDALATSLHTLAALISDRMKRERPAP